MDDDEYTGIEAQNDPDFYLEGYSLQELENIREYRESCKEPYDEC